MLVHIPTYDYGLTGWGGELEFVEKRHPARAASSIPNLTVLQLGLATWCMGVTVARASRV